MAVVRHFLDAKLRCGTDGRGHCHRRRGRPIFFDEYMKVVSEPLHENISKLRLHSTKRGQLRSALPDCCPETDLRSLLQSKNFEQFNLHGQNNTTPGEQRSTSIRSRARRLLIIFVAFLSTNILHLPEFPTTPGISHGRFLVLLFLWRWSHGGCTLLCCLWPHQVWQLHAVGAIPA